MKILLIRNRFKKDITLGYVLYFEKTKTFNIEIEKNATFEDLPIVLDLFASRGVYSLNSYYSKLWIEDRVVPIDRQNIGDILKEAGLDEYDLFKLLVLNQGRCTNDDYELIKVNSLPDSITSRFIHKVLDVLALDNNELLCFFLNGECKKVDVNKLKESDHRFGLILKDANEFKKVHILPGGYGVSFDNDVFIEDDVLYKNGKTIDIKYDDFISFVKNNIVDTYEATQILECTRQNIDDLIKRGKISPIKSGKKNNLFIKEDIKNRDVLK